MGSGTLDPALPMPAAPLLWERPTLRVRIVPHKVVCLSVFFAYTFSPRTCFLVSGRLWAVGEALVDPQEPDLGELFR